MSTEKFIRRWEKYRRKGQGRYALINGILMGMGVSVGSMTSILITRKSFDLYNHFGYFIGGFIGGVIGVLISWERNEKKYYKLLQDK